MWRRCTDYVPSEVKVRCVECTHLHGDYCYIAEFPVTGADKDNSCDFFVSKKVNLVD